MDFLNEKALFQDTLRPALDKVDQETIPAVERALQRQVEAAAAQLAGIVAGALEGLQAAGEKLLADARREIAALDGWAVEIGEIRIPPISIRLTGPKGEKQ